MGHRLETSADSSLSLEHEALFEDQAPRSLLAQSLAALAHDRAAMLGAVLFLALVGMAVLAGVIAPYNPLAVHPQDRLQLPSRAYLLGTDELGRDLLSRIIYGSRVSISVGLISVGIAASTGIPLGLIGGYRGGLTDAVIMRVMDALLAFPGIILALAIISALGPGLVNAMIAIGIVSIPGFARITRASVLSVKEEEFVVAARAIGAADFYVMFRVLLPNCLSPLLVKTSVSFAGAILTEAALAFLGLGVPPPTPSWGAMLDTGRQYLDQTPWYSFSAGAAIFLAVLGMNLLGDGLRDALDPRLRQV
ncbi:MAG TPA: ABC transporter permease [Chloroflexota bacterium]|nr:ABC transporter permease [Chloroflexota bacterium]